MNFEVGKTYRVVKPELIFKSETTLDNQPITEGFKFVVTNIHEDGSIWTNNIMFMGNPPPDDEGWCIVHPGNYEAVEEVK